MSTYLADVNEVLAASGGSGMTEEELSKALRAKRETMSCRLLRRALSGGVTARALRKCGIFYSLKSQKGGGNTEVENQTARFFEEDPTGEKLRARAVRQLGWSPEKAVGVLDAYKQFIHVKADQQDFDATGLSPSTMVDEMWHLHVLDTRDYNAACHRAFGKILHHDADGDIDEDARDTRRAEARAAVQDAFPMSFDREVWEFPTSCPETASNPAEAPIILASNVTFQIRIVTPTGLSTRFLVSNKTLVSQVFNAFSQREGIPMDEIRWVYKGHELDPYELDDTDVTLQGLNFKDGDILLARLKLTGC